ncbi:hypothetical protein AALP_AA7G039700 [Arabis alpina]|uniref:Pre-mRNA-splicing factor SLU7 n=1 Tax=Arabis alpina TaxID=50452 RepID=A0A087GFS9_ARAAL|nr:hypothetical protein AALP_AA7G039700 [Arabis alpina]
MSAAPWYDRGAKTYQAEKYQKGACQNCGAITHDAKACMARPRHVGAKFTNKNIAPDEKIESLKLSYDAKRDRWNGYDPLIHHHRVTELFEAKDEARNTYLKEQKLKKLEEKTNNQEGDATNDVDEEEDDDLRVDEAKESAYQRRHSKILVDLDVNSAHYDPKSRSMREGPLPDADPNDKFYLGDNQYRNSGQALEFRQMNIHSCEAFDKGHDTHIQAAPSQAELLYKNFKLAKEKMKSQTKDTIMEKYGNAATKDEIPMELLLGQSEIQVEYDRAGRIIKGQEVTLPKSKYEEDVYVNNHISVWGSHWKDHQWGYTCCHQTIRNSYCTGSAGIEAANTSVCVLGVHEDELKREVKDERKRKYYVEYNNDVTPEEMEAYRMKRVHYEDPMKDIICF